MPSWVMARCATGATSIGAIAFIGSISVVALSADANTFAATSPGSGRPELGRDRLRDATRGCATGADAAGAVGPAIGVATRAGGFGRSRRAVVRGGTGCACRGSVLLRGSSTARTSIAAAASGAMIQILRRKAGAPDDP